MYITPSVVTPKTLPIANPNTRKRIGDTPGVLCQSAPYRCHTRRGLGSASRVGGRIVTVTVTASCRKIDRQPYITGVERAAVTVAGRGPRGGGGARTVP